MMPTFLRTWEGVTAWRAAIVALDVAVIAGAIFLLGLAFEPTAKEKRLCGEAIDKVMTTKDLVEFERAKFLIEQVHGCRLGMPAD